MKKRIPLLLGIALLIIYNLNHARSIHRPVDPMTPKISTRWLDGSPQYHLKDSRLEEDPIFKTFDKEHYKSHMLPREAIQYRYDNTKTVSGEALSKLISKLITEIHQKKKKYTDFIVLKDWDFSSRDKSGLLIFKFKDHPFILKLFMETPQGFVRPYAKGFEPSCFFVMGSTMRHMTGFTRIKNMRAIKKKVAQDPFWSNIVDFPRKWYWEPENNRWFEVIGTNVGPHNYSRIELPSVYGIVCDEIKAAKKVSYLDRHHRKICMELSRFLKYRVDPHIKNFLIEKDTNKTVMIDTEYFPLLVGLKREMKAKTYSAWYLKLTGKFATDKLFQNKKKRHMRQLKPTCILSST